MANHPPPPAEGIADDFFEQIFAYGAGASMGGMDAPAVDGGGMILQLNSADGHGHVTGGATGFAPTAPAASGEVFHHSLLGLSLDQGSAGFMKAEDGSASATAKQYHHDPAAVNANKMSSSSKRHFHGQPNPGAVSVVQHPPAPRPRVRARRGQATDPHSIAERLRRERIAERMRSLQELVPNSNKTDRAAMLDEIVDYVKFLRLQVKVLSMSRLGGAGAVAQLVADIPLSNVEAMANDNQQVWEKWSMDGTEQQVAKLMEEDVGAAMQFLQSKALCIMPISLAATIYHTPHQQPEASSLTKADSDAPS